MNDSSNERLRDSPLHNLLKSTLNATIRSNEQHEKSDGSVRTDEKISERVIER